MELKDFEVFLRDLKGVKGIQRDLNRFKRDLNGLKELLREVVD